MKPVFNLDGVGLTPEEIAKDAEQRITEIPAETSFLIVKKSIEWCEAAGKRPMPKKIFGYLWFEGEICVLYSDTNLGKTILAVQGAQGIAAGTNILGMDVETPPQLVLYFDCELSDKQFQVRYTDDAGNIFPFHENFYRAEIDSDSEKPEEFDTVDDFIIHSIEQAVRKRGFKILIVDNITYLRTETEKAKDALPLMKQLKDLKKKYGLSILVLAHTPKRDLSKPISRNDLAGSKMIINFCDSAFALGESNKEKSLRYIKQMKQRNCECKFDSENVVVIELRKEGNFLGFHFVGYGTEREHLKQVTQKEKEERLAKVLELRDAGKTNVEIAAEMGVSEGAVRKWLKKQDGDAPI